MQFIEFPRIAGSWEYAFSKRRNGLFGEHRRPRKIRKILEKAKYSPIDRKGQFIGGFGESLRLTMFLRFGWF
jgi:hypothetical protein